MRRVSKMYRLIYVFLTALILSGCGIDSGGFERGYIISHSEAGDQLPSESIDE